MVSGEGRRDSSYSDRWPVLRDIRIDVAQESHRVFRDTLADTVQDKADVRKILEEAGLKTLVDDGRVIDMWTAALSAASNQQTLHVLVDTAVRNVQSLKNRLPIVLDSLSEPAYGKSPSRDLPLRREAALTPQGIVTLAMQLDREKQWKHLERAHEHPHVLFVLYGTHRQSLRLFVDRIRYDLANIRQQPQTLVEVPARRYSGDSGPRRGIDWVRRAAKEVERIKGISGKAPAETLVEAARQDDLLLVLGPLRLRTVLEKVDIKNGLFQFIRAELDDIFTRHAESTSSAGLRFVLYLQTSEPRVDAEHALIDELKSTALEIARAARNRERPAEPHIQPLPEARFPDWDEDIEPFLFRVHASDEVFEVARRAHKKLHAPDSEMSFARFAEILEEELTAL